MASDDRRVAASLVAPIVSLRPVEPGDAIALYRLALSPRNIVRWRYRGTTPSFERFSQELWNGVLAQFAFVAPREPGRVLGLVTAYDADHRGKTAWLSVVADDESTPGTGIAACALFIRYLFDSFDFRWVYLESIEFNEASFASGRGSYYEEVARLPQHEFHNGRYWDRIYSRVTRTMFFSTAPRLFPWLGSQEPGGAGG